MSAASPGRYACLPSIPEVMADPGVRDWVRRAIAELLVRDCVDAANDAELLAAVMARRCDDILREVGKGARPRSRALLLDGASLEVRARAGRLMARESTDFLGRLSEALMTAEALCEGDVLADEDASEYRDAMLEVAALAMAQAAMAAEQVQRRRCSRPAAAIGASDARRTSCRHDDWETAVKSEPWRPPVAGSPIEIDEPDPYLGAEDPSSITEEDVYRALDFLVAVEPRPPVFTETEYDEATADYRDQILLAKDVLRGFVLQRQPLALPDMQAMYERFLQTVRYRGPRNSGVVSTSLNRAWDQVGPWRCSVPGLWRPYPEPDEPDQLTEDEVRVALDFLIAVEPDPPSATLEDYHAALKPYRDDIARAERTIRNFAEQGPMTLEQMRIDYYGFTNDPRYLRSAMVSSVVTSALNAAWHGVGPWRR